MLQVTVGLGVALGKLERKRTAWKEIRYRLEGRGLNQPRNALHLSREACYPLALLVGSLAAMLDRQGRRVALSHLHMGLQ